MIFVRVERGRRRRLARARCAPRSRCRCGTRRRSSRARSGPRSRARPLRIDDERERLARASPGSRLRHVGGLHRRGRRPRRRGRRAEPAARGRRARLRLRDDVVSSGRSTTMKTAAKRTIANTMLTAGPAPIATSRRHVFWRQYASGASDISSSCHARVSPSAGRSSSSASRAPLSSPRSSAESSARELGCVLLRHARSQASPRAVPGSGRLMPGIFT